jgi:cysteine desulfurase / selenocysteine lyase
MTDQHSEFRERMVVSRQYAYFDHAAVGPLPDSAALAISNYAFQASSHGDVPWLDWFGAVGRLRETAGRFIGASPEEIALVNNTTQGINLIAEGFPWQQGDNVLVAENEFPSNLLPWRNLARRGVELRTFPVPPAGDICTDAIRPMVDAKTRIIAVSWVGFLSGFRSDVQQLVEFAHAHGCLLAVDAIQGLGAFPLDVRKTNVDFLCADGHKWMLGPEGAGILYVKSEHLNLLQPLGLGWGSLAAGQFDPHSLEIKKTADRYEGGSTNMGGMIGFGESLKLLEKCGAGLEASPIAKSILENVSELKELLMAAGCIVHLPDAERNRSGIVGITWPAADEKVYLQARKFCIERGVVLSVRGGRLRASTHGYNNRDDVNRLVQAIVEFRCS